MHFERRPEKVDIRRCVRPHVDRSERHTLPVYRESLIAARDVEAIASALPQDRVDLRDQLRRASASIVLNIAEGADEFAPAEKARFYRMARRSASEVAATLEFVDAVIPRPPPTHASRESIERIIAGLRKLVFVQQRRR